MIAIRLTLSALLLVLLAQSCSSGSVSTKPQTPEQEQETDDTSIIDKFVHIPANSSYTMLADATNALGKGEAAPIDSDYYICKYAVTNSEWKQFVDATDHTAPKYWNGNEYPTGKGDHPVVWISYAEAEAYCHWIGASITGYEFRLPTQAEWEYAATGTGRTVYPWGNSAQSTYANAVLDSRFNYNAVVGAHILNQGGMATYNNSKSTRYGQQEPVSDIFSISSTGGVTGWIDHDNYTGFVYTDIFTQLNNTGGYTCAVDAYPDGVSQWGCYNMSGNCWEWTSTIETALNGAEKGQIVNVVRGGSWYATAGSCRVSYRGEGRKSTGVYATVGMRIVAVKR